VHILALAEELGEGRERNLIIHEIPFLPCRKKTAMDLEIGQKLNSWCNLLKLLKSIFNSVCCVSLIMAMRIFRSF
jgi:hypothetical protein